MWFTTLSHRITVSDFLLHQPWHYTVAFALVLALPLRTFKAIKSSSLIIVADWSVSLILFASFLTCSTLDWNSNLMLIRHHLLPLSKLHLSCFSCSRNGYPCFCSSVSCQMKNTKCWRLIPQISNCMLETPTVFLQSLLLCCFPLLQHCWLSHFWLPIFANSRRLIPGMIFVSPLVFSHLSLILQALFFKARIFLFRTSENPLNQNSPNDSPRDEKFISGNSGCFSFPPILNASGDLTCDRH